MIRTILFAMRTDTANVMLGANAWAIRARRAKSQRALVDMALRDARFGKPPALVEPGRLNRYDVTITRVSAGVADWDGAVTAVKYVRDGVAAFLGLDDRDPSIAWTVLQARCEKGYQGVRVRIEDEEPGGTIDIVLGQGPRRIGPESESGAGQLPAKRAERRQIARDGAVVVPKPRPAPPAPVEQATLPLRTAWALRGWEQDGSGMPVLAEVELPLDGDPPPWIRVEVPALVRTMTIHARDTILRLAARYVRLDRHHVEHPELGPGTSIVYAERHAPELRFFERSEGSAAE
jgi:hypothetical protein